MAKFVVREDGPKLRITIDAAREDQAAVLGALQECAQGRCTCPTSQYEKLDSVDIAAGPESVSVVLTPKAGDAIDRDAIDKCLEYTAGNSPRAE